MVRIAVIFYSTYGHIYKMAQSVAKGINSVPGCEAVLLQVQETLSSEVLAKMHAPPKPDVPVVDVNDLPSYDGFLFGIPTRFGMMAAQMKAMFDATGGHWQSGALVNKPAGIFFSTATQNGGQETTAFTAVTQLAHHGMIFCPPGYSMPGGKLFGLDAPHGGSPWGAGTLAGPDGSRQPSELELEYAEHQGSHFAATAKKLAA
ncbi:hypothetical protein Ndes2526B_g04089 [Nannochloris sp. 'desiccata']|nr:hypothetical protein KSW81_001123 [Chlorella desiccata (nom. nud.)]